MGGEHELFWFIRQAADHRRTAWIQVPGQSIFRLVKKMY